MFFAAVLIKLRSSEASLVWYHLLNYIFWKVPITIASLFIDAQKLFLVTRDIKSVLKLKSI